MIKGDEKKEFIALSKNILTSPNGKRWLGLLKKHFHGNQSTTRSDTHGRVDPYETIFLEGQRTVPIYLEALINKKDKEVEE
jgi:hypothetical protein